MKKFLFALAALVATTAAASAQGPGYDPNLMPAGHAHGGMVHGGFAHGGGYGHPGIGHGGVGLPKPGLFGGFFGGIFTNHKGGFGKGRYHDRVNNATMLPVATSGTLVFPQNPFIRSPRDFFMAGDK